MAKGSERALTVVLVHGAFCDPTVWSPVMTQLRAEGVTVYAPANPLRRLATDTAHLAGVIRSLDRVLLAGHAYGGAVITGAAARAGNVAGLVYVTGYALDDGESTADVDRRFPPTRWGVTVRDGGLTIDRGAFPAVFAADLPVPVAMAMAGRQTPISPACRTDRSPGAAWRRLPSWYLIAADDRCLSPAAQWFMARRAGSRITETAGSHAVAVSQTTAVADVVLTAARAAR